MAYHLKNVILMKKFDQIFLLKTDIDIQSYFFTFFGFNCFNCLIHNQILLNLK